MIAGCLGGENGGVVANDDRLMSSELCEGRVFAGDARFFSLIPR